MMEFRSADRTMFPLPQLRGTAALHVNNCYQRKTGVPARAMRTNPGLTPIAHKPGKQPNTSLQSV
jgi:hypothetical protein